MWGGLVLAYFAEALSRPVLLGERDLSSFFFPTVKLWLETLRLGEFPLWNPYSFAGQPLFASLQAGVLYPPNALLFFLPPVFGFNLIIALHFFLAGWFVYHLVRELEGSPAAGILAALSFSLGGFLLSLHTVLSSLQSAAWAPLVLFLFLRALRRESKVYGLFTLAAVLVQFLGGGIEIFLMTQVLVVNLAAFPRFWNTPGDRPSWPWHLKLTCGLYLLFLGLGAFQIFPFWEMVRESSRGSGFSFEQATRWSLSLKDLGNLLFPDFFWRGMGYYYEDQNWLKSIYLGCIPLGLLSIYFRYGGGRRAWWAGLLLFSLVLALGRHTPLYGVLYRIVPGLSLIRYPAKFFFLVHLVLCLLAGFGWDALVKKIRTSDERGRPGFKRMALTLALALAGLTLAALLFQTAVMEYLRTPYSEVPARTWTANLHNLVRLTVVALLVLISLALLADRKISPAWGGRWLIVLLAADLFLGNWGEYRLFDREAYLKTSPNLEIAKKDRELYRVYSHRQVLKALVPAGEREWRTADFHQERFYLDYPLVHRVRNALGFQVLVFKPIRDLLVLLETAPRPDTTDVLRLLNVKYILWSEPIVSPDFRLVRRMGPHYIPGPKQGGRPDRTPEVRSFEPLLYEIRHTLPRAALIPEARVVSGERELGDLIKGRGFEPERTVLLEEPPVLSQGGASAAPLRDEIRWGAGTNTRLELEASCAGPRMLLLSEPDYPGWQARVNGKPARIYRANHAFQALALGAGTHAIRLEYRPASFRWGLAVSGMSLLSLLLGAVFFRVRKQGLGPEGDAEERAGFRDRPERYSG
jgi:hypothetical protein